MSPRAIAPLETGACLSLPPTLALARLLEDPRLPERVAALPSQELHRLIQHIGRADSLELIALARPEQVRELLDLDVWQGESLDAAEALDWLNLLASLPDPGRTRDLSALDVELVGCVLLKHLRIHVIEDGELPDELGDLRQTPDGWFALEVLTADAGAAERALELVDALYRVNPDDARRLLHNLTCELVDQLEELGLRWRNGRLQDLGFADPSEALRVYAYLDPRTVRIGERTADRPPVADPEPVPAGTALVAISPEPGSFWSRALSSVTDAAERERLSFALLTLSNLCLSADGVAPSDPDAARSALERLDARLSLGLEHLCDGDVERTPAALTSVALLRLARIGHSLTLDVRRQVIGEARSGRFGPGPGRVDWLDAPLGRQIAALLATRPLLYEAETDRTRPFRTRADLRTAEGCVARARAAADLVDALGLPSPRPPTATFGDLFRTRLHHHLLGRSPSGPADRESLGAFVRRFVREGALDPAVLRAALEHLPDPGRQASLVADWVRRLEESCARLDPERLDLRYVDGFWLAETPDRAPRRGSSPGG